MAVYIDMSLLVCENLSAIKHVNFVDLWPLDYGDPFFFFFLNLFDLSSSGTLTQFAECTYDLKGIHPLNFVLT